MDIGRRRLLAGGTLALGGAGVYALTRGETGDGGEPTPEPVADDEAAGVAARFAPDLYFGARERWFPTDPRRYASDDGEDRVVDGFDALDGYTRDRREADDPPAPTVFYHVVDYPDDPLRVVQFWLYAAFDQFTTNFHWHDWELLQTFVDTGADRAVVHSASAHSRAVPNNEYLDPTVERAAVLSEVGSHSSALGLNATRDQFERLPIGDSGPDVTNQVVTAAGVVEALPAAYGLPRDEGFGLPFLVPELDGAPLPDHPRLPNVRTEDLLPEDVTVRSRTALERPPTGLPERERGETWTHADSGADGDVTYDLVPMAELEEIDRLTGPTLSFGAPVPGFAEDLVASHLSPASMPRSQPRFDRPEADVTDPVHRSALAERYAGVSPGGVFSRLVGAVRETAQSPDAPADEGLTTVAPTVEATALVESEPTPVPTSAGRVIARVPPGEHRVTLDAPGAAPYAERVEAREGPEPTRVGVDGAVPVVSTGSAVKIRLEEAAETGVERVALEDDFAGRLYDAPPDDDGRAAVYAHESGAYTVEVRDTEGVTGAYRANPDPGSGSDSDEEVTLRGVTTGKTPLAEFVRDLLSETLAKTRAAGDGSAESTESTESTARRRTDPPAQRETDGETEASTPTPTGTGTTGVVNGLEDALSAAEAAVARAAESDEPGADRRLAAVRRRLDGLGRAVEQSSLSERFRELLRRRLAILDRRAQEALDAPA